MPSAVDPIHYKDVVRLCFLCQAKSRVIWVTRGTFELKVQTKGDRRGRREREKRTDDVKENMKSESEGHFNIIEGRERGRKGREVEERQ